MLLVITFASAINSNITAVEKKESPLYNIRTGLAIGEKISQILENIKTKFLGERIFFIPLKWIKNLNPNINRNPTTYDKTTGLCTCWHIFCDTEIIVCGKDG